ncbi:RhoGEF domain [Pelomyxa schiedti]|nr:RhoGEF domain [Pelomyxa schiedti]
MDDAAVGRIVNKFATNEREYMGWLQVLAEVFLYPLRSSYIAHDLQMHALFSNSKELLRVQGELVAIINRRQPPISLIGDLFTQIIPHLNDYIIYTTNYSKCVSTLNELMENKKFSSFLQRQQADSRCEGLDLLALLTLPMHRVSVYTRLLEELIESHSLTEKDSAILMSYLHIVQTVLLRIDNELRCENEGDDPHEDIFPGAGAVDSEINVPGPAITSKELIQGLREFEKEYSSHLSITIEGFLKPLKSLLNLNIDQTKKLFCNLPEIYQLHRDVFVFIEDAAQLDTLAQIEKFFAHLAPNVGLYVTYAANYQQCAQSIQHLKKNSKFVSYIKTQLANPELESFDLLTLLSQPVHAIPRYIRLLEELLSQIDATHILFYTFRSYFHLMKGMEIEIEDAIAEEENKQKVMQIQNKLNITISGVKLLEPHRRFVKEGKLLRIKKGRNKKTAHLYLFNDLLIEGSWSVMGFVVKSVLSLSGICVFEMANTSNFSNLFVVVHKEKSCVFSAANSTERDGWVQTLTETQSKLHQRRKTLHCAQIFKTAGPELQPTAACSNSKPEVTASPTPDVVQLTSPTPDTAAEVPPLPSTPEVKPANSAPSTPETSRSNVPPPLSPLSPLVHHGIARADSPLPPPLSPTGLHAPPPPLSPTMHGGTHHVVPHHWVHSVTYPSHPTTPPLLTQALHMSSPHHTFLCHKPIPQPSTTPPTSTTTSTSTSTSTSTTTSTSATSASDPETIESTTPQPNSIPSPSYSDPSSICNIPPVSDPSGTTVDKL